MGFRLSNMLLLAVLLALHLDSSLGIQDCTRDQRYWRIYAFNDRTTMRMSDNRCMANLVPGAWCAWEPLETGHGVTSCQRGLNIRWRRRLCNCPPPRPISDPSTWCRPEKNATAVAQLVDQASDVQPLTRLEALKSDIWILPKRWQLKWPFSRVSPVTNSLLGCLQFEECYFHTGGLYTGKENVTFNGFNCLPWKDFSKDLESAGMQKSELNAFLASGVENQCRNPLHFLPHRQTSSARLKPWCFHNAERLREKATLNYYTRGVWDYCNIRSCGATRFWGTYHFPSSTFSKRPNHVEVMTSYKEPLEDRSLDVNGESCFATCRFKCEKYAALNVRTTGSSVSRCCQCFSEEHIEDPRVTFSTNSVDNLLPDQKDRQKENDERLGYRGSAGPYTAMVWRHCYLYNSPFQCPMVDLWGYKSIMAAAFEVALPSNCHETNRLLSDSYSDTMTVFGVMGNFETIQEVSRLNSGVLLSSRGAVSSGISTMCSHRGPHAPSCTPFNGASVQDPNSYFNNVIDADYHWIIFDLGVHAHVALVELEGSPMALQQSELLVRSATLPNWLSESSFVSSTGETGMRTEYFRRATLADQMLWWRCEDIKISGRKILAECSPHQRTRWVMLRLKVHTDMLEMKYSLGYNWIMPLEMCCLVVDKLTVKKLRSDSFNCIAMHHPPMGPEYADYWEDLYSFDVDGQPLDPPRITPVHPQFRLPLLTHDSVHPEEKFVQEDWDVEACGDWELLENTSIVGVPAKLKITFTASDPRGEICPERKQSISPADTGTRCQRSVYFRVDSSAGEVVHYPDFGRSYDLTGSLRNCQFVCAIARECKALEFMQGAFCRLHLISYKLDTMFVYTHNVVYGLKSDIMRTTNPFTWNNPFHPYYRLLQDLLAEAGFSH